MKPRDTILLPEQRDALDRVRVKKLAPEMVSDLKNAVTIAECVFAGGVVSIEMESDYAIIAEHLIKAGWTKK